MYYTILPSQPILDKLHLDRLIVEDLHAVLFVSTDESLASNVLSHLNSLPPTSNILEAMMYDKQPDAFQLRSVEDTTNFPDILRSTIADKVDTDVWPYNYLFPEGLANIGRTLESCQKCVKRDFPDDANIVAELRNRFGPNII